MASHRILLGGKQMRYILKNEQNVAGGVQLVYVGSNVPPEIVILIKNLIAGEVDVH